MSAAATDRPSPVWGALRAVLAAGGWTNALLALAWGLSAVLPALGIGEEKVVGAGPVLAAVLVMFWAMFGGSRLLALSVQARRLRLPRIAASNLHHAAVSLLLAAGIPALLATLSGTQPLPLNLAIVLLGLLTGLFWASMPPWLLFVLLPLGYLPLWVQPWLEHAEPLDLTLAQGLALVLLALLAANAGGWWHMARRQFPAQGWRTPLALAFANGMRTAAPQIQQNQYSSAWFTQDTPIGHGLHRQPEQALAIALGPAFGRSTFKSVLGSQGPVLAVGLLWLGLDNSDGAKVGLFFAPLLAISPALAPLMRLQTLFRLPGLGLHELALLPGLPHPAAPALLKLLGRQMLLRMLPALAIMAATGFLMGAGRAFYPLLFWSSSGSLLLLQGMGLLSLHRRFYRWMLAASAVVLTVSIFASMLAGLGEHPPAWLLSAWQVACLLGAVLSGVAQNRLRAVPHLWLAN